MAWFVVVAALQLPLVAPGRLHVAPNSAPSLQFNCSTQGVDSVALSMVAVQGHEVPSQHASAAQLLGSDQRTYCPRHDCRSFIEIGTNGGSAVLALDQHHAFRHLFSAEMDATLFKAGVNLLHDRERVHLYHGDMEDTLPRMIHDAEARDADAGILFWLQHHFTRTSLLHEIQIILDAVRHPTRAVIMMAELHKYTGVPEKHRHPHTQITFWWTYPKPSEVQRIVCARFPASHFTMADDTFVAYPNPGAGVRL